MVRQKEIGLAIFLVYFMMLCYGTDACYCLDRDRYYCMSDFAVKIKVLDETRSNKMFPDTKDPEKIEIDRKLAEYFYDVEVLETYRGNIDMASPIVHTFGAEELCGKRMTPGKTYLLGSLLRNNPDRGWVLSVGECSILTEVGTGTAEEQEVVNYISNPPDCGNNTPFPLYFR